MHSSFPPKFHSKKLKYKQIIVRYTNKFQLILFYSSILPNVNISGILFKYFFKEDYD